ncbi:GH116 family glycosyl-hydrolase [Fulvitalea axinellae]
MKKQSIVALILGMLVPVVSYCAGEKDKVKYLQFYKGSSHDHVAMPVGGIGTGTVSVDFRGKLVDWEIMNQGAIGFLPFFNEHYAATRVAPFFAIRTKTADGKIDARMLEGAIPKSKLEGDWGCDELNSTFPRFHGSEMQTAYPIAKVDLIDETVPVNVSMKAFNPLIPGKTDDSSLPVAMLEYTVSNPGNSPVEVTLCGTVPNYVGFDGFKNKIKQNYNIYRNNDGVKGIFMSTNSADTLDSRWGSMALTTTYDGQVSYRTSWHPDLIWNGSVINFWDDLKDDGLLKQHKGKKAKEYTEYNMLNEFQGEVKDRSVPASLAVKVILKPGETKTVPFMLSWHFPKRISWESMPGWEKAAFDNYYARNFADAWDVAKQVSSRYDDLKEGTENFVNDFVSQDVPQSIKEAAMSNLANMRCQTLFRDGDGYSYGWEGQGSVLGTALNPKGIRGGWGPGTCTHVWNYESTIPYTFGDVAMSMREVEFGYCTDLKTGKMAHRVRLPLKTERQTVGAAADGQLGTIIRMYREWQLSGDTEKLKELYPYVKRSLQYVWQASKWDADKNGVIEGKHHNTMDVSYIGPNPEMGTWYLGALRAGEEMAKVMKDKAFAKECRQLFETGSAWMDANMFNGEYYIQLLPKPMNFQVGEAVLVHQMVGQQMAHMSGLGYLLKPENVKKSLESVMKYNYRTNWDQHLSTFRSYITRDEAGLMNAYYPEGKREARPFPYFSEPWTGLEYHTAAGMIFEDMESNGEKVVASVRDRYNGTNRNPFNEGEFGHRYARAMSSWSPLIAFTRFQYQGNIKRMTIRAEEGTYYWSNGYSYGTVDVKKKGDKFGATLKVNAGSLPLKTLTFIGTDHKEINTVKVRGKKAIAEGETVVLK